MTQIDMPDKMPLIDLVRSIVQARYEKSMPEAKKAVILAVATRYGLMDEGRPTGKYLALIDGSIEDYARELTGQIARYGQCPCGCKRTLRGRAKYATLACKQRVYRKRANG